MEHCVFCNIVKDNSKASIVYADEKALAFMDIQPVNPGHTLVVPRSHISRLSQLDENTGVHMFKVAMRVAEGLKHSCVRCEGVNLLLSDGEAAFQEIFHVHLHVIPRFQGDGFSIRFGRQYGSKPDKNELDKIAQCIREAMR